MKRAGIIPVAKLCRSEEVDQAEREPDSIDTAVWESAGYAKDIVVPDINEGKINSPNIDAGLSQAAGSMNGYGPTGTAPVPARLSTPPARTTTPWRRSDERSQPSWAPRYSGPFVDPLVVGERMFQHESIKRQAEDDAWGISLKMLGPRGTWSSRLCRWWVDFEGFKANLIARSAEDAGAMFCSVCGRSYADAIRVSLLGSFSYSDEHLARLLSRWRENLKKSFQEWVKTPEGHELAYKAQKAYGEAEFAKESEERMEAEYRWQRQLEAEHDARLQAGRRKKQAERNSRRPWENSYRGGFQYEKYDDGGEDDNEVC
jgi:hypothetical protein